MKSEPQKKRTFLDHFTLFSGVAYLFCVISLSWIAQTEPGFIVIVIPFTICFSPIILITNFRRATEGEPSRWRLAHGIVTAMTLLILSGPIMYFIAESFRQRFR